MTKEEKENNRNTPNSAAFSNERPTIPQNQGILLLITDTIRPSARQGIPNSVAVPKQQNCTVVSSDTMPKAPQGVQNMMFSNSTLLSQLHSAQSSNALQNVTAETEEKFKDDLHLLILISKTRYFF